MSEERFAAREALAEWLRVARRSDGAFEAVLEDHFGSAQRGDLLARCALAALAEGSGELSSLHASWLADPPPRVPIALRIRPVDAERGLCEIDAAAGDLALCRATARVEPRAPGLAFHDAQLPASLPSPESLPRAVEYARKEGWPEVYAGGPVEFRRVGPLRPQRSLDESSDHVTWLALRAPLSRDLQLAQAALVFLTCFYDHWEFERRIGERFDHGRFAVREQRVQIHRAARPEGWLLLRASAGVASAGVALGARELFAASGELLASGLCEALVAAA